MTYRESNSQLAVVNYHNLKKNAMYQSSRWIPIHRVHNHQTLHWCQSSSVRLRRESVNAKRDLLRAQRQATQTPRAVFPPPPNRISLLSNQVRWLRQFSQTYDKQLWLAPQSTPAFTCIQAMGKRKWIDTATLTIVIEIVWDFSAFCIIRMSHLGKVSKKKWSW